MSEAQPKSSGTNVWLIVGIVVGAGFCLLAIPAALVIALLLPAVQKVRSAAETMQSANDMKVMGMAMQNYVNDHTTFPPRAIYGKDGEPLLSWRVAILPYVEHQDLYQRFHLDEPWDSAHNKALLAEMPSVYALPKEKAKPGTVTHYQVVVGKGTMFEESKKGLTIADIPDGTSNTALIVEATTAVPWTKPEDLVYDPNGPLPAVGLPDKDTFNVMMADASVRHFRLKPNNPAAWEQSLRRLFVRNDGQPIDFGPLE